MAESGVSHGRAMLRIYEPRLRLRLMTRLGEAIASPSSPSLCSFSAEALLLPYLRTYYSRRQWPYWVR